MLLTYLWKDESEIIWFLFRRPGAHFHISFCCLNCPCEDPVERSSHLSLQTWTNNGGHLPSNAALQCCWTWALFSSAAMSAMLAEALKCVEMDCVRLLGGHNIGPRWVVSPVTFIFS